VLAPTVLWTLPWSAATDTASRPAPGLDGPYGGEIHLAADWPLDGSLRMPAPDAPDAPADADLWVFRWDGARWRPAGPLGGDPDQPRWYALGSPGLHAVFRDRTAPWIDPRPLEVTVREPSAVPGVTLPRWITVPVEIVDRGTGVDDASIGASLDGVPLIVEPDLIRHRVLVTVPDGTAPGRHELRLEAADAAGNRAERSLVVQVR
ncbi:MAG: hypothetical protein IH621_04305, partial [Krumholzibacteria bacterium]|nr:hypothetical protein [Candidatus Krumholzibacteria bacterium]